MTTKIIEGLCKQCMGVLSEMDYVLTIVNHEPILQNFFDLKEDQYFIEYDKDDQFFIVNKKIGRTLGDKDRYEDLKSALKQLNKVQNGSGIRFV